MKIPLRYNIDPTEVCQLKAFSNEWKKKINTNKQKRILSEEVRVQKEFLEMFYYYVNTDVEITYSHRWLLVWYNFHKKEYKRLKRAGRLYDTLGNPTVNSD